jgi:hypothetical protein
VAPGCAQLRKRGDGGAQVVVGHVAEDPAHLDEVGGDGTGVAVGGAGVATSYVDDEIVRGGVLRGRPGQALVELEQCRSHPRAVGTGRQHLQQVAPVARAGADHPQVLVVCARRATA